MTTPDRGEERASELDTVYRELYPSLVRFSQGIVGSRSDAEDAVHDAFVAAVRSEPGGDPRPWLYRVTRNASIDLLRRRRDTVEIDSMQDSLPTEASAEPYASLELGERLALLRAGLAALPERGRTALLLRELAGLPYMEIGEVMDTSEGNVKVLIFRARESLSELTDAAELECSSVRLALSAAADGEASRIDRAGARLHTVHCKRCRGFTRTVGSQKVAIASLIPLVGVPHAVGLASGGAVGGGVAGAKAAFGALLAAATIGVSAGGVVVLTSGHERWGIHTGAAGSSLAAPPPPQGHPAAASRSPEAGDANETETVAASESPRASESEAASGSGQATPPSGTEVGDGGAAQNPTGQDSGPSTAQSVSFVSESDGGSESAD